MSCAACSARVEKAVSGVDGVKSCAVSLLTNSMGVEGDVEPGKIIAAVEKVGYGARLRGAAAEQRSGRTGGKVPAEDVDGFRNKEIPKLAGRLAASAVFLLILMYCSMGHGMWNWPLPAVFDNHVFMGIVQMALSAVVMVINQKFFVSGFRALFHGGPNMDTLIALGSGTAFAYSFAQLLMMAAAEGRGEAEAVMKIGMNLYFESAAMILTLITVGKLLESVSKGRTTDALKNLVKMAPKTAVVLENGAEKTVSVDEVRVGDVFVLRPGDSIPVDGTVEEGSGSVNEAALTGESIPVDKEPGDRVSTGTVNLTGYMKCRALRVGEDTTLSQIIKMVSDSAATKAPLARIADRVSGVFVPAVILIAMLTLAGWMIAGRPFTFAVGRAITVLVISCPCALGLATPVAVMVGSGVGAKNGILYKTAASLETLGRVRVIALDKTGTITEGEPEVKAVIPAEGVTAADLLKLAASVEQGSEHPLASAVMKKASAEGISAEEIADFEALPGNGVRARLINGGIEITGGSVGFVDREFGLGEALSAEAKRQAEAGNTPLAFAAGGKTVGLICAADTIKPDSAEAVASLKSMGIKTVMLTGDNENTAGSIAAVSGVDDVVADVRPDGKEAEVRKLSQLGKVAMVGDGINDAPALVSADVGLAIGAGTDVALDAADIVLVKSRLTDVSSAVKISKATIRNIYENLFWAFIYNIICIPLAIGVFGLEMKPMYGAAAMSLSSFCVCINALRLNLIRLNGKNAGRNSGGREKAGGSGAGNAVEAISDVKNDDPEKADLKNEDPEKAALENDDPTKDDAKKEDAGKRIVYNNKETISMTRIFKVEGMMCSHCEARVKKAVEAIPGVVSAAPDHEKNICEVTAGPDVSDDSIKAAITEQGYTVL